MTDNHERWAAIMRDRSPADMAKRIVQLEDHIQSMNSGRVLTCVYCGQPYEPGTPTHGTEVLTKHIEECPKHPYGMLRSRITGMVDELSGSPTTRGVAHVLRALLDGEPPMPENTERTCRAGHTYVTDASLPGRCWCGESVSLETV